MMTRHRTCGLLALSFYCSVLDGCTPKESNVCDGVVGSCMDLLISGSGAYSKLEVTLGRTTSANPQIISGGVIPNVPYHVRIIPPAGTRTSEFGRISARALNSANKIESAKIEGLYWPDDSHVSYSLKLQPEPNVNSPFSSLSRHFTFSGSVSEITDADFDKDGKIDIAAAIWSAGEIAVAYGDGFGGFQERFSIPSGKSPNDIASADIDKDSYPDLAVANYGGGSITTFLNGKVRVFSLKQTLSGISAPAYLKLDDLNRDGIIDLAHQTTASTPMPSSWTEYRWGIGDGTFGGPAGTMAGMASQGAIHSGDMNRDGLKDLVIGGNSSMCNTLFVLPYDGKGFFPKTNYIQKAQGLLSTRPTYLWLFDLNNDGSTDIAAVNLDATSGANAIEILLNRGDGLSYTSSLYNAGLNPWKITGSDLDLDGKPELLVANSGEESVEILYLGTDGRVNRTVRVAVNGQPSCIKATDMNNDKRPDMIVCSGNGIDVFLNTTL